jgi:NodT family efflux transporter outer membrane factor (OMF) lipoprotein
MPMARRSVRRLGFIVAILVVAAGCTVGPRYVRPDVITPPAYKEMEGWKTAQPADAVLHGAWWEMFGDPQLAELEAQVVVTNQTLRAAEAQFRQARAIVQAARSAYFPTLTIGIGYTRSRQPALVSGGSGATVAAMTSEHSTFILPLDASWEPDLWGRVRRSVESTGASAQATAADVETSRLSLQAELATDYFLLRELDGQKQILDRAAAAFETSLRLTQDRFGGGVASRTDVVQAETQLRTTQAQAIDVGVQRAQLEHAIALLIGRPASTFSLPAMALRTAPPAVPVGLPSHLLERRPDIAGAERRVAAANAQIGVAQAAFYPTVTLSASAGLQSAGLAQWLAWPSRFWSVGPGITQTVLDGGLRRAQKAQAVAAYEGTVASYREAVLGAFGEVEDNLAALRILAEEAQVQEGAVAAARESVTLTTDQYRGGTVSYLDVIVTQTALLTNERTALDILGRRLNASVLLIKALGGGWDASSLPPARAG